MVLNKNKCVVGIIALAIGLGGCSVVGPRTSPLVDATQSSPTVSDVYHGRTGSAQQQRERAEGRAVLRDSAGARAIGAGDDHAQRYWSAIEPMQQRFQRVPNPDLVMVVYPHLAKGKYPVPGYVTVFPMYEELHYALPGEVENDLANARQLYRPAPPPEKAQGKATRTIRNTGVEARQ